MSNPELEYIACPTANCGGQWLPAAKVQQLRDSHQTFYCPAGHSQWFAGKSVKEKRIEELEKLVTTLRKDRDNYKLLWEQERAAYKKERLRQYALKGYITRLKRAI